MSKKAVSLPRHVPNCWPAGFARKHLRKLIAPRSKAEGDVYASEAFMEPLYKNHRPQDMHPLDAQPSWRLAKLLDSRLPGWERLFKPKWSASDLLDLSDNVTDAGFLNAVHIYKHMIGKYFPTGVFDWPATEWLQSYRERKARVRDSKAHPDEPDRKRVRLFGKPSDDVVLRAEGTGCQPKPTGCQPKPTAETLAAALARGREPDPARAKAASSSTSSKTGAKAASSATSSTVLSGARAKPTGMLKISDKWSADVGTQL